MNILGSQDTHHIEEALAVRDTQGAAPTHSTHTQNTIATGGETLAFFWGRFEPKKQKLRISGQVFDVTALPIFEQNQGGSPGPHFWGKRREA